MANLVIFVNKLIILVCISINTKSRFYITASYLTTEKLMTFGSVTYKKWNNNYVIDLITNRFKDFWFHILKFSIKTMIEIANIKHSYTANLFLFIFLPSLLIFCNLLELFYLPPTNKIIVLL